MKKNIDSDYMMLKLSFDDIKRLPLIDLLIIKMYLLSLKTLDSKCEKLEEDNRIKVQIDTYINYYIGAKLFTDISEASDLHDKKKLNNSIKLVRKETRRLNDFKHSFNTKSNYDCILTKESAKGIMLEYMAPDEVCSCALKVYPDGVKQLVK